MWWTALGLLLLLLVPVTLILIGLDGMLASSFGLMTAGLAALAVLGAWIRLALRRPAALIRASSLQGPRSANFWWGATLDGAGLSLTVGAVIWLASGSIGRPPEGTPELGQLASGAAGSFLVGWVVVVRWINRTRFPDGLRATADTLVDGRLINQPGNPLEFGVALMLTALLLANAEGMSILSLRNSILMVFVLLVLPMFASALFFFSLVDSLRPWAWRKRGRSEGQAT
jgi:hypothetical protein